MRAFALATLLLAGTAHAAPLTPSQTAAIDEAATRALATTGVPAASIAVVRDGAVVYTHAYGQQREGQPATTEGKYKIASISKQFTAAAILLLAEDGKLSLDDPVSKYLPDLTRAGDVKVRQLLSHTSGYRDFWPQDFAFVDMQTPATPAHILDKWAKLPLDFEPGSRWQYSNTGYVAAGLIVEKVSGQPLMAFLKARVFDRLGMRAVDQDTGMTAADPLGYQRFALGPVRVEPQPGAGWLFAAGGLAMTASDLARWDISVIDQSVMRPTSYAEQQRSVLLTNGTSSNYGLGVDVQNVKGHRRISHGGEAAGYLSENRIYPDEKAAIIVLDNADFGNAQTAIADAIEKILFADSGDTSRALSVYRSLRDGRIDRSAFTENGNFYLTARAVADYRTSLMPLGEPKSITRDSSALRGGLTAEKYTLDFGTRKLTIVLRAQPGPNGRIEQFSVYPAS
ncbi:serine hydrolase domain-containing protein [Sphingomonas sp. MMS24-J13]|uniref:serine hydrolase domain-containing protein n=1 Tax=Sphingomonas sp. MMS24-J13 TaxID=3238686 RepID=UPI00384C6897